MWQIDRVRCKSRRGKHLYFDCYSKYYKKNVVVELNLKNNEFISIVD